MKSQEKPNTSEDQPGKGLDAATCSLWPCCGRSRRTKFCPDCGSPRPQASQAQEMLAEITSELRKYTSTCDTFTAKADAMEKVIGYLPQDCGWGIMDAAQIIDSYDVNATIERMAAMEDEELREAFAAGLRESVRNNRRMAAAAAKNMLKWKRWHQVLSDLISQANARSARTGAQERSES